LGSTPTLTTDKKNLKESQRKLGKDENGRTIFRLNYRKKIKDKQFLPSAVTDKNGRDEDVAV